MMRTHIRPSNVFPHQRSRGLFERVQYQRKRGCLLALTQKFGDEEEIVCSSVCEVERRGHGYGQLVDETDAGETSPGTDYGIKW